MRPSAWPACHPQASLSRRLPACPAAPRPSDVQPGCSTAARATAAARPDVGPLQACLGYRLCPRQPTPPVATPPPHLVQELLLEHLEDGDVHASIGQDAQHGGHHAPVEGAPALLRQHLARAVQDAGVGARGAHRQPSAHQLQGVDDGLGRGARQRACDHALRGGDLIGVVRHHLHARSSRRAASSMGCLFNNVISSGPVLRHDLCRSGQREKAASPTLPLQ